MDKIEPIALVRKLVKEVRDTNLDQRSTTDWTKALKACLGTLQVEGGLRDVVYSETASDRHEFLLDVVAWDRDDGEGLSLAVECEWLQTLQEIENDFWKLLVVKAPVKLMIFACPKGGRKFNQKTSWEAISKCLKSYKGHVEGELYVFIDFAPEPIRTAWWIQIPRTEHGKLIDLPERKLIDLSSGNEA